MEEEVVCSKEVCWSEAAKREDADLGDAVSCSNACGEANHSDSAPSMRRTWRAVEDRVRLIV